MTSFALSHTGFACKASFMAFTYALRAGVSMLSGLASAKLASLPGDVEGSTLPFGCGSGNEHHLPAVEVLIPRFDRVRGPSDASATETAQAFAIRQRHCLTALFGIAAFAQTSLHVTGVRTSRRK